MKYNNLPKRTKTHEIEAESRRTFQQKIPNSWCMNIPTESVEYGVDANISISRNNYMTGEEFKVQFKASNKKNSKLSIQLPITTYNYYQNISQIMPVLMVFYDVKNKNHYAKWFHNFDPYYNEDGKKVHRKHNAKSISFYWNSNDIWNANSAHQIETDLELYFKIKNSLIVEPFSFYIDIKDNSIYDIPASLIISELENKFKDLGFIYFSYIKDDTVVGNIELSSSELVCSFLQNTGGIFHLENKRALNLTQITEIMIMQIVIAFYSINYYQYAFRIASLLLDSPLIYEFTEYFNIISKIFVQTDCWDKYLVLLNNYMKQNNILFSSEDQIINYLNINLILLKYRAEFKKNSLYDILTSNISNALKTKDINLIANSYYNLGNSLRKDHFRRAFHCYNQARKYSPDYLKRGYFWQELGGILFCLKKYKKSALYYAKSLRTEYKPNTLKLYADALFYSGKIISANKRFQQYFTTKNGQEDACGWFLKLIASSFILNITGINKQLRQIDAANKLIETYVNNNIEPTEQNIESILRLDVLSSEAWHQYASLLQKDNNSNYIYALLCSAILANDLHDFATLIINAKFSGLPDADIALIMNYSLDYIINIDTNKFMKILNKISPSNSDDIINYIHKLINYKLKNLPKEECILRFFDDNKSYITIDLNQ